MNHRVRANMRFTAASGLAIWCRDQMAVRYDQSVVIREGDPNEEAPVNEVEPDGDHERFRCDLILADESAAVDAFATLSDHTVLNQAEPSDTEDGDDIPSWVERHECRHDHDPPGPCIVVERATA